MRKLIAMSLAAGLALSACSGSGEGNNATVEAGNDSGVINDVSPVDDGGSLDNGALGLDNASDPGTGDLNAADLGGNSGDIASNAL